MIEFYTFGGVRSNRIARRAVSGFAGQVSDLVGRGDHLGDDRSHVVFPGAVVDEARP